MDVKINGNSGLHIQNDYFARVNDNIKSDNEVKSGRRAILERSVSSYGKIADICYNRKSLYSNEDEQTIADYNRESTMLECIDILKSSVTPEDYSQLEAWGLIPDKDNPEAFVSVYERIQIELAAYCDDYDISGLNINKEKMKNVLGSESMANALSKANDIAAETSLLSNETKKYIMANEIEPTLENVYKAIHSGASTNSAASLSVEQWNQLKSQVEDFFDSNGIEKNSGNFDNAKWIISQELPLTVENFDKLSNLNKVDFSNKEYMENLNQNIAYTIYFGGDAMTTDVTGKAFDMDTVREALNTVRDAMDQDVDYILKNNKKLNIENLKLRIEERKKEYILNNDEHEKIHTQKNKVLAEARAILTAGSLFMMQKTGINISYTEITIMVEMTHAVNTSYADKVFALEDYLPAEDERELLTHTIEVMSGFKRLPIGVAAGIYNKTIEYTPLSVYEEGMSLASRYRMAAETYEAVGTEVRADLGDTISKAFRNLDEILTTCGALVDDRNRRAARVLSYNSMDITKEAVEDMADITSNLDELTKNLTPRAAMYLIKKGINPLQTNIKELNDMLVDINANLYEGDTYEKYSEYLWKLEKNKSITKQERDAYIQMYRIIEHVNRQDGSAVGAVAKAEGEMTLANLYTAVKIRQTGNIDKKIDEATGLFDGRYGDDTLAKYFEGTVEIMQDKELHYEYMYEQFKNKLNSINDIQTMSEEEFLRYVSGGNGTSIENIYCSMAASDKHLYKKLMDFNDKKVKESVSKISDTWKSENTEYVEKIGESDLTKDFEELRDNVSAIEDDNTADTAIAKTNMVQVVDFMAKQAQKRSYYIPMEISGETTIVHMTIKQGEGHNKGRINVYADTKEGRISVLMSAKGLNQGYEILTATDSFELKNKLQGLLDEDAKVVYAQKIFDGMWNGMDNSERDMEEVGFGELVRQAKSFIHNVLKKL